MRSTIYWVIPALLFIAGCASPFFDENVIAHLKQSTSEDSKVLFDRTSITFSDNGERIDTEHTVLLIGKNTRVSPEYFWVYDGDIEKLSHFYTRFLHPDGSSETFSQGDLHSVATSSSERISEEYIKFIPLTDYPSEGDIVEMVIVHEFLLPELGVNFDVGAPGSVSDNVSLSVHLPAHASANYKVVNDNSSPERQILPDSSSVYSFAWPTLSLKKPVSVFAASNNSPRVLFASPKPKEKGQLSWQDFGNWYLQLFTPRTVPGTELKQKAESITAGLQTNLDKLNALFEYCQKNIRYEQVYLDKGGFIPNDCNVIFSHNFADCKDYTTILYTMARHLGIPVSPALCFLGRGVEAFQDIPTSQFNHMILYYSENGKDYWYDGTNRDAAPGLLTSDLINQTALVLEFNKSRLLTINEDEKNCLSISGNLTAAQSDLNGELKVTLDGQYGMDFRYLEFVMNGKEMKAYVSRWVEKHLNSGWVISGITSQKTANGYEIAIKGKIPNALTVIDSVYYFSPLSGFANLLPELPRKDRDAIFYYPHYAHVRLNLSIQNLHKDDAPASQAFAYNTEYTMPAGPFTEATRALFLSQFDKCQTTLKKKDKLLRRIQ